MVAGRGAVARFSALNKRDYAFVAVSSGSKNQHPQEDAEDQDDEEDNDRNEE